MLEEPGMLFVYAKIAERPELNIEQMNTEHGTDEV
jgi:hypothetical protein